MSRYSVYGETVTGIADAVRNLRHESGTMTPAQIEAKIRASRLGLPIDISNHLVDGVWQRPDDWPDLDALAETIADDETCLYLTYDLRKTPGYGWIGVRCDGPSGTTYIVERGHVANGAFVADETHSQSVSAYFRQDLDDINGDVQLWRVRSDANIRRFGFCPRSTTTAENYRNNMQPCVERSGNLPYATDLYSNVGTGGTVMCYGTIWMERDSFVPGKYSVVTRLASCWYQCVSLQSLDLSKWNTSNWNIGDFSSCWSECYSLQVLDVSKWDTSNWTVTSIVSCWNRCHSLLKLDLSNWNTSNWTTRSLQYVWQRCYSLQSLNLSGWTTGNWRITSLYATWSGCYSLRELDIADWDTSNWAVTSVRYCWQDCHTLCALDLSKWDTTNWAVTDSRTCFGECYSLVSLDLPVSFGILSTQTTNVAEHVPNIPTIQDFSGVEIYMNHTYALAYMLTPESCLNIVNRLPTVSSSRTITLGDNKLKLTDAQIAIATQKGWTVA